MSKEYLHINNEIASPYEFIERDIEIYGEEYCLGLDNSEFLLHYGITKDEFLNEFSLDYSDFTKEKLISKKKLHPFNEQSFENLVENFKNESVKLLTSPTISSEGSNRRSNPSPLQPRTSVRPSKVKAKNNNTKTDRAKNVNELHRGFKPIQKQKKKKPRPTPYPAPPTQQQKNESNNILQKEYKLYVKSLHRLMRSPLARKRIKLHDKAFRSAMLEEGIQWGSETWIELLLKFFPGTNVSAFTLEDNDGEDQIPDRTSKNGDQEEINSGAQAQNESGEHGQANSESSKTEDNCDQEEPEGDNTNIVEDGNENVIKEELLLLNALIINPTL